MAKKINKKTLKDNSKTKKVIKKKKKRINPALIIAIITIVVIACVIYANKDILFKQPSEEALVVARLNGEEISLKEINIAYGRLSDEYKTVVTKENILDEIIAERLLLQEAEKQGITATKEEAARIIDNAIIQSEISEEEFKSNLDSLNISRDYLDEYYRKQIVISRLLNNTLFKKITVSDMEIKQFYEKNLIALQNITLEDSRDEIQDMLLSEKKKSAYLTYLNQLKAEANIEIFLDKPIVKTLKKLEALNVFKETADSICKEDNKPVIRLYTTTNCQSCIWITEKFDFFVKEYQKQNKIVAYHWELDTGDNTLTKEIETGIPKLELEIFKKYNPKSTVPTFIFGCKYVRIGNAYEEQKNLDAEKLEFENIANKLTS